jgi:hypothetical protein
MNHLSKRAKPLAFLLCITIVILAACGSVSQQSLAPQNQLVTPTSDKQPAPTSDQPQAATSVSVSTPALINLIANSGFETGDLTGWIADGDAGISKADAHTGAWSAKIASTGGGQSHVETVIETAVGTTYKLTGWIKILSDAGDDWGGFRLALSSWDWAQSAETESLTAKSHGTAWFKVALTFTATTPQTRVRAEYFGGPGRAMVVHVDDLALFERHTNRLPEVQVGLNPVEVASVPQLQQYSLSGDDPDGAIVRVMWDFGDGTRALTPSGERRVALPGSYQATVRVADDEGAVTTRVLTWAAQGGGFPALAVDVPSAVETTVNQASLSVSGSADTSTARILVSSDRGFVGAASGTAQWSAQLALQPGLNRILVQAYGADGRIATAERLVRYIPDGPLRIVGLAERAPSVQRWDVQEITFALENSAATDPQFPYDPALPPGLEWTDGISVDGLFTPDDWQTIYRRPAFLNQPYERALKQGEEWLYPAGDLVWTVRFAPPVLGTWKYRIDVHEARGEARSEDRTFEVVPGAQPRNHGPVLVAPHDSRYFEFADGMPFLGAGHGVGIDAERFSYDMIDLFDAVGQDNQQLFRWWLGGNIWGSAWQAWRSQTLEYDGYVPATGLSVERAYADQLAALKLDAANPIAVQGLDTGHAGLIAGRTYRIRVRWRTEGVTGPATPGQPYGATVKFVDWPEVGQTGDLPALIPHVNGDTPWHIAEADFVAQGDFMPNLALILENTTTGATYVDEVDAYEVLPGGALGPQLLRGARFNSHLVFDPRRGSGVDAILAEAATRGLYFKLVISEKNEYLLNHLGPDSLPDPRGGQFDGGAGTPNRRLHEYYWRYLFARFGAFRSIHSWELANEAAPSPGAHFELAGLLAQQAARDGNPHLATTSTWATLADDAWKDPASAAIAYTDFHAYVRTTGWIEPKDELADDTARMFGEYDQAARAAGFGKPVIWGEVGIDSDDGSSDEEPRLALDLEGVWLHKLTWARCGPGGVYPLYWYTDNIYDKSLHHIFGAWNRFMAGIPLTNGRFEDIAAIASVPDLRVFGQKDLADGSAYAWIDNSRHTWRAVVDGRRIQDVSGTIHIPMQRPGMSFAVTWYDTQTGLPLSTERQSADDQGELVLNIASLKTDIAVKIARGDT